MCSRMTTIDGRSPGSRVSAGRRLPGISRSSSGVMAHGSPLTVAGSAAALGCPFTAFPFDPRKEPSNPDRIARLQGASIGGVFGAIDTASRRSHRWLWSDGPSEQRVNRERGRRLSAPRPWLPPQLYVDSRTPIQPLAMPRFGDNREGGERRRPTSQETGQRTSSDATGGVPRRGSEAPHALYRVGWPPRIRFRAFPYSRRLGGKLCGIWRRYRSPSSPVSWVRARRH